MGRHGRAAHDALHARPGERIIDIRCGPGISAVALAGEVAPDGWVYALDIVPQMAAAAKRRRCRQRATRIRGGRRRRQCRSGCGGRVRSAVRRGPLEFGLMFFSEPSRPSNIFSRCGQGTARRVGVAHLDRNPWMLLTTATAAQILGIDRPPLPHQEPRAVLAG